MSKKTDISPLIAVIALLSIFGIIYLIFEEQKRKKQKRANKKLRDIIMNDDELARNFLKEIRDAQLTSTPKEIKVGSKNYQVSSLG